MLETREHICELLESAGASSFICSKRESRPSKLKKGIRKGRPEGFPNPSADCPPTDSFSTFYLEVSMHNLSKRLLCTLGVFN